MSQKKRVVAVCPDCLHVYWQEAPAGFGGPRKVPSRREVSINALCHQADEVNGLRIVYYRMRCADCSVRLAPPALKETLRKWLKVGETK